MLGSDEEVEGTGVDVLPLVGMNESDHVPLIDEGLGCIVGTPGSTVAFSVPVMTGRVSPDIVLSFEGVADDWSLAERPGLPEAED